MSKVSMEVHDENRFEPGAGSRITLCASTTMAGEVGDTYIAVHGGLFLFSFDAPEGVDIGSAKDPGFGATFGYFVIPNLAVEGELGYALGSDVSFKGRTVLEGQSVNVEFDGPTGNLLHINGNAHYEIGTGGSATPFVVAGLGIMNVGGTDEEVVTGTVDGQSTQLQLPKTEGSTELSVNFGGGVAVPVGLNALRLEYRLFVVFTEGDTSTASRLGVAFAFGL